MRDYPEHGYIESDDDHIYYWRASTLWKLAESLQVVEFSLADFDWTSDNFQCNSLSEPPLWRDIGDHAKRILAADLSHPIIISAEGDVMDGMHRILKCYTFGLPTVKAVIFDRTPEPDIIYPADDA